MIGVISMKEKFDELEKALLKSNAKYAEAVGQIDSLIGYGHDREIEKKILWERFEGLTKNKLLLEMEKAKLEVKNEALQLQKQTLAENAQSLMATNKMLRSQAEQIAKQQQAKYQEAEEVEANIPTPEQAAFAAKYVYETMLSAVTSVNIHIQMFVEGSVQGELPYLSNVRRCLEAQPVASEWNRSSILGTLHSKLSDEDKARVMILLYPILSNFDEAGLSKLFKEHYYPDFEPKGEQEWRLYVDTGNVPLLSFLNQAWQYFTMPVPALGKHLDQGPKIKRPMSAKATKAFDNIVQCFFDLMFESNK